MQTTNAVKVGREVSPLPKPFLCPGACAVCIATGTPDIPGCPCVDPKATLQDVRAFEVEAAARILSRDPDWTISGKSDVRQ